MRKFIIAVSLSILPLLGFAQDQTKTKILTVEILGTYGWKNPISKGIYIHWPNKEVEKIIFKKCDSYDECIMTRGKVVRDKLQELYDDGWVLEGLTGGDSYSRYVFRKK